MGLTTNQELIKAKMTILYTDQQISELIDQSNGALRYINESKSKSFFLDSGVKINEPKNMGLTSNRELTEAKVVILYKDHQILEPFIR